jgi:SNF2-related domain
MTLALVLATLDQLSSPEESILDTRPVMTPLAFKYFPSKQYSEARQRASSRSGKAESTSNSGDIRVPSLLETMIHYVRVFPEGLDLQAHEEELQAHRLWDPIAFNTPFYHHYDIKVPTTGRASRNCSRSDAAPRVMYLSSATLIVVPTNLLSQWESEVNKHCGPRSSLRVLVLQKEIEIPSARIMASNYDVRSPLSDDMLLTFTNFRLF